MTDAYDDRTPPDPIASIFSHGAFAALIAEAAPSLITAVVPFRVLWANRPAGEMFGAPDAAVLTDRLNRSPSGTARLLTHLASRLDVDAAPRLERLRFVQDLSYRSITVLCQRVDLPDGRAVLAMATVGLGQPDDADARSLWREPAPGFEGDEAFGAAREVPTGPSGPVAADGGSTRFPADADALRAELLQALGGVDQGRFVWRSDETGSLGQAETGVFAALGAPIGPASGTPLADTIRSFDEAAAERLAAAVARRQTFSGIEVGWPVAGGAAVLPVRLRASPWFLPGQRFAGFRGFGTFDLAALQPCAIPVKTTEPGPPEIRQAIEGDPAPPATDHQDTSSEPTADAPAVQPIRPNPPESRFSALANVVRLWPLGGRLTSPSGAEPQAGLADGAAERPSLQPRSQSPGPDHDPAEPVGDGLAGPHEPAKTEEAGAPAEPEGDPDPPPYVSLSSSEHEAFAEIGRRLAGRDGDDDRPTGERRPFIDDLSRNAAALVETTTSGMMVTRGRILLFANQALIDALHFPTHADFDLAVGTALAQQAPDQVEADEITIALPRHDGETLLFDVQQRPIRWNRQPARLWMMRETHAEPHDDANPGRMVRALLDAAGDAAALMDGTGAVMLLNRQGERWFGRDTRRLAGEHFTLLLAPESRPAAAALLSEMRDSPIGGAEARGEVTARTPDGSALTLDMRLGRVEENRYSVVWRDVSALKRHERDFARARLDAEQASDRQPELLAKLSHQLRTPLNAIIGFAEVMMDERFGPLGNDRYKDYLKDIHASGTHVMSLVKDLLDLSRIEAGRHDLDLGAVDINRIIGDCVAEMQPQAHRDRVIVRTSFSPRQPMILADDRAARQIIANLLSNAVKFNEPGGQVIVSTTTGDNGVVVVRIRDTGIGMSDKQIAAALEPFRQLAPAKHAGGTGLGLPLAKALVGVNGASLSIRSRPGEGTMVEVAFQPSPSVARVPA